MYLPVNTTLDNHRYRIVKQIGKSGFGDVYLADELYYGYDRYSQVSEQVVIKELFVTGICQRTGLEVVPRPEYEAQWADLKKRVENEHPLPNRARHPNAIAVLDRFLENNTVYTVTNYVDGTFLEDILCVEKRLPVTVAMKYVAEILSALADFHGRGIYFFDVRPVNILIETNTDRAMLSTFGLPLSFVRDADSILSQNITRNSVYLIGKATPYCPLEIEHALIDVNNDYWQPATIDLYSVGATLYRCLTGNNPPPASSLVTGKEKLAGDIGAELLSIIEKAMNVEVDLRFSSAIEMLGAITVLR